MPDLTLLLGLLAPVAALLLLNLRLSRKLSYPHDLLKADTRRGPAAFLFRSFRTYYDVFLDAAIALVLAFALAATAPWARAAPAGERAADKARKALVVDCSRSMLLGQPGKRPLDLALSKAYPEDPASLPKGTARFALAYDSGRGGTRLYPLDPILDGTTGEVAASRLANALAFLEVDYRAMGELAARGYDDIVLLTDALPASPTGFSAEESGFAEGFSAYPTACHPDRIAGGWRLAFATRGRPARIEASRFDAKSGTFEVAARGSVRVEETLGGIALRLPSEGLWRVSLEGSGGELASVYAFRLWPDGRSAAAAGQFSSRLLATFPYLEAAPRPQVVFLDGDSAGGKGKPVPQGPRAVLVRTGLGGTGPATYLAPRLSGGRAILGGAILLEGRIAGGSGEGEAGAAAADFLLGPASLANPDLPLAYDGALSALDAPAWLTLGKTAGGGLTMVGGLAYLGGGGKASDFAAGAMPVTTGAGESFPPIKEGRIVLVRPEAARAFWALALALLFAAKLAAWKRSSGKSLFRRAAS